jgi:hypothetical protein
MLDARLPVGWMNGGLKQQLVEAKISPCAEF